MNILWLILRLPTSKYLLLETYIVKTEIRSSPYRNCLRLCGRPFTIICITIAPLKMKNMNNVYSNLWFPFWESSNVFQSFLAIKFPHFNYCVAYNFCIPFFFCGLCKNGALACFLGEVTLIKMPSLQADRFSLLKALWTAVWNSGQSTLEMLPSWESGICQSGFLSPPWFPAPAHQLIIIFLISCGWLGTRQFLLNLADYLQVKYQTNLS